MKIFSAFAIISSLCCLFVHASPIEQCNRRLNVLLLGYYGSGKSTIVNVLHGLFDLKINDKREIAKTGNHMRSVTQNCTGYDCSNGDIKLHVVDTPGFENNEATNNKVASLISEKVPMLLKDGLDAFLFTFPVTRVPDDQLANVFNFITSLITKEGYKHGIIVFTSADDVKMTEKEEKLKIEELRNEMLRIAPQAEELLYTVKYLFYRHRSAEDGDENTIFFPETRKMFHFQAYSEVYKNCVNNNGKTFSTQAMIEAKRKYEENKKELDALQKDREQLRMNFQRITLFGGSLSSDLQKLKNDIEKMGFRNINIASSMTQEEVLTIERKSKTDNEKLVKTVQDYFFLEKERAQIMKNTTTLQNQADELVQKYNEAKKACLDQINWIRSVDINNREIPPPNGDLRVSSAFLGGISVSWSNALRVAKPLFAEAVQYFRNKLTEDSKINNDKIVKPTLQSDNATFENYSKYAEKLTTFNNMVKQRTQEIQSATDKNRGRAFKLWEYPEIQKIINFFMESGIRTYSPKRKNVEERLSNTSICFCPN